jgi:hypothetical protein
LPTRLASARAFAARMIILLGTHPQYGAFPADQGQLDARHPQARFGEASGDGLPTHTEPDHYHVGLNSHYGPFHSGH